MIQLEKKGRKRINPPENLTAPLIQVVPGGEEELLFFFFLILVGRQGGGSPRGWRVEIELVLALVGVFVVLIFFMFSLLFSFNKHA